METCTVETGLLKKKPCGQAMVTRCVTCEQPLCKQHAVAQAREPGKPPKFMCKECDAARKAYEKNVPPSMPIPAPAAAPAKPAEAPKPAPAAPIAMAPAPKAPVAPAAAPAAAKPAPKAEEPKPDKLSDTGPIEFTPTKK
jgi:hypothetical protein